MNRREATLILRELLEECDGALLTSGAFLSTTESGYELSINCVLDDHLRKCVNTVAERHQLRIREQGGTVTIYRQTS